MDTKGANHKKEKRKKEEKRKKKIRKKKKETNSNLVILRNIALDSHRKSNPDVKI